MSAKGLRFTDLLEFQFELKTLEKHMFSCSFQVLIGGFCVRSRCSATTHGQHRAHMGGQMGNTAGNTEGNTGQAGACQLRW